LFINEIIAFARFLLNLEGKKIFKKKNVYVLYIIILIGKKIIDTVSSVVVLITLSNEPHL